MPSSGTVSIRFTSVAADEPAIKIDDCIISSADNIGSVAQASLYGTLKYAPTANCEWSSSSTSLAAFSADTDCATPAVTGGVVAPSTKIPGFTMNNLGPGTYKVTAQFLAGRGGTSDQGHNWSMTDGITTATQNSTYFNTSTLYAPMTMVGFFTYPTAQSSVTIQIYGQTKSGSNTVKILADTANSDAPLYFIVEKIPTTSQLAITPDLAASSWSGYHDTTCSWSVTSTSYADFTPDPSCSLVERTNTNFGTVSTSGSVKPAITFTPKSAGKYWVCATLSYFTGNNVNSAIRLWDGTTTISEVASNTSSGRTDIPLCGIYNATSTSHVTLSLQAQTDSGSANINFARQTQSTLEWSIFAMDRPFPQPIVGTDASYGSALLNLGSRVDQSVSSAAWTTFNNAGFTGWALTGRATPPATSGDLGVKIPNLPSGRYMVTARGSFYASGGPDCMFAIYDGTTREARYSNASTANSAGGDVTGIFEYTTTADRNFVVQATRFSGTGNCTVSVHNSAANQFADFRITVIPLNQFITTTGVLNLAGQVTSDSQGAVRAEYATITNAGTCVISSQSGTWLTSPTHPATGQCSFTLSGWSTAPSCTCNFAGPAASNTCSSIQSTTTTLVTQTYNSGGAASDQNIHIICMGPR
jgi:hypothetical protein